MNDSDEKILGNWLGYVGFDNHDGSYRIPIEKFEDQGQARVELELYQIPDQDFWVTEVVSFNRHNVETDRVGLVRSWCETRVQLRELCGALGITLNE